MSADADLIRTELRLALAYFDRRERLRGYAGGIKESIAALDRLAAEREEMAEMLASIGYQIRDGVRFTPHQADEAIILSEGRSKPRSASSWSPVPAASAQLHALMRACSITEAQVLAFTHKNTEWFSDVSSLAALPDCAIETLVENWPKIIADLSERSDAEPSLSSPMSIKTDADLIQECLMEHRGAGLMLANSSKIRAHCDKNDAALAALARFRKLAGDAGMEAANAWSPVPPTEWGFVWHWSGDPAESATLMNIAIVQTTGKAMVLHNFPAQSDCEKLGGYWQPLRVPETGSAQKEGV